MRFSVLAVCGLVATAAGAPAGKANVQSYTIHESRESLPAGWEKNAKLHPDSYFPMRIALKQSNMDKAASFLDDVSHPESPNYGKHWTPQQVAETFAPSGETVNAVSRWLTEAGVGGFKQSAGLNWIEFKITAAQAEKLLRTKYFEFVHEASGKSHIACEDYQLPAELQEHIDFITPTVHFDVKVDQPRKKEVEKRQSTADVHPNTAKNVGQPGTGVVNPKLGPEVGPGTIFDELMQCNTYITPDCLRALYKFPPDFPSNPRNSYGIVEYTPQAYLQTDLNIFFANSSPPLVGQGPIPYFIDGGVDQTTAQGFEYNGESDLDLEYAMSLVYPQRVSLYQVGDTVEGASFNDFLDALDGSYCTFDGGDDDSQDAVYPDPLPGGYAGPKACGGYPITKVISTSYAYNEADLTPFYENRQCNEYLKLGLQGTTFLYSSGDYGVAGNGGQCIDPATGDYNNGQSGKFNPSFPGTCPYILSVGATQVKPSVTNVLTTTQPEQACESVIYSGGGFSNVFPMPSYQKAAVAKYFANHNPPYGADRYNNSMKTRGFPDVSANGANYVTTIDGRFARVFGTSASSPTFGSILTLINGARLDIGKSSVGFVNPAFYANPSVLTDIVTGGNQGCGTPGFTAVPGWDPVTGLGTPNFPAMLAYFLALP